MSTSNFVKSNMLKWARERLGLSHENVEALSKKLGKSFSIVNAPALKTWESGASVPDLEHLETLAEIYVCPVGYFFLSNPPKEISGLSYRGLAQNKEEGLNWQSRQALQRFRELIEWATFLIKEHNITWESKIQSVSMDSLDIDNLVKRESERLGFNSEIRKKWHNANDAFYWWRKQIENLGVFCFQLKLSPDTVRGASRWVESRYPFILINHQDVEAAAGRIFTLLHEYFHLLTPQKEGIICDFRGISQASPEPFANRFAARMLVSYDEIQKRLKDLEINRYREQWSDQLLDKIRQPFFISRDVITIALQEMGFAPVDLYQKKRERWGKRRPWGRGRPLTKKERKLRELGFSLTNVLSKHAKEGTMSPSDLAYFLDMKVERVTEFLEWSRNATGPQKP